MTTLSPYDREFYRIARIQQPEPERQHAEFDWWRTLEVTLILLIFADIDFGAYALVRWAWHLVLMYWRGR